MKFPYCPHNPICTKVAHVEKALTWCVETSTETAIPDSFGRGLGSCMMQVVMEQGPTAQALRNEIPPSPNRCDGCIFTRLQQT